MIYCPYCGEGPLEEDDEILTCPDCMREGCDYCMSAGRNFMCPECEEAALSPTQETGGER